MWFDYKPYVNVAERRKRAAAAMKRRKKKGLPVDPVVITGKGIATSFWGRAWCTHLEALGDYANRLPRGRTYARNGSVCHLEIVPGRVKALVMGTELYEVELTITRLPATRWRQLKKRCAGAVGSVLELLEGRISDAVMREITNPTEGMFPTVRQIKTNCSCPDWAGVCKHVAAAFYGVGARLDERPDLLFTLRGVDLQELIDEGAGALTRVTGKGGARRLTGDGIGDVFGIDLIDDGHAPDRPSPSIRDGKPMKRAVTDAAPIKSAVRATDRRGPKIAAKRKAGKRSNSTRPTPSTFKEGAVTGASVAALRRKLGLTQIQLARLLGMSAASVARWESVRGRLELHSRSEAALRRVARMTPLGAKRALSGL